MQPLQQTLNDTAAALRDQLTKAQEMLTQLNEQRDKLQKMLASLGDEAVDPAMADMAVQLLLSGTEAQLQLGEFRVSSGKTQLEAGKTQLEAAQEEYESAREEALKSANLNQLLNMTTLQQLIYAQNFSMPAGYIEGGDGDDNRYIVKVGDAFADADELKSMVLCNIDGIGDVRLSDVAEVEMTDNADDAYAKVDKNRAVLLSLYKSSTASTSTVSNASSAAMETMMAENEGLHLTPIMDQGDYIKLIVNSVLSNLIEGAVLAIIVLALFLKDLRPTIVVAISMPLSVLFAIVLMYFTGITFNILSLSGLALGVGMLVDNSVVVIENIYRLRGRGVPAARAAVQGARQVGMSVVASTLTSVCVFLPAVFSASLIRSLMGPMSLCIGYCLMASLIVALTVVPAASATVLKNAQPKKLAWFDKIQDAYGRSLEKALQKRFVPLAAAVLLLVFCCWRVVSMGIVLLPTSTSNEAMITLSTTDTLSQDESYDVAGKVVQAVMAVDGVEEVGITPDNTVAGMDVSNLGLPSAITDLLNAANGYGKYKINVKLNEDLSSSKIDAACKAMEEAVAGVADCTATVKQYGMTDDLTSQLSTGLTIKIYGTDAETLTALSEKVIDIVNNTDGFQNATNGLGAGDSTIILQVDRDKVRAYGLTVAQVYQQIAAKLTTTTTAQTPVTVDGTTMDVQISNNLDPLTKENMMDMTFETTVMSADGTTATGTCTLADIASWTTGNAPDSITSENQNQYVTVTAETCLLYTSDAADE